eukprot:GGOE01036803.1.p1 GENE.GGOE01036803.1~~GGOE01036803.1.p1  ORF type:complete len:540 (+),score=83.89 GGOE01036803.1:46-1665(+)
MSLGGTGTPSLLLDPGFFSHLPRDLPRVPSPLPGDFRHIQQRRQEPPKTSADASHVSEVMAWDAESSVRSSPCESSHADTEPAAGTGPELRILIMSLQRLALLPVPPHPNCYVTVAVGEELRRTEVAWGMAEPEWGEELTFYPSKLAENRLRCDFGLFHHQPSAADHCLATASLLLDGLPRDQFESHTVLLGDLVELSVMLKFIGCHVGQERCIGDNDSGRTTPPTGGALQLWEMEEEAQRERLTAAELDEWISILTPFVEAERRRSAERHSAARRNSVKSATASEASDQETEDGLAKCQRELWRQQQAELRHLENEALARQMAEPPSPVSKDRPAAGRHHPQHPELPLRGARPPTVDRPHLLRPSELAVYQQQDAEVERLLHVQSLSLNDDLQLFEGSVADLDQSDFRLSKLVSPILRPSQQPAERGRPPQAMPSSPSIPPDLNSVTPAPPKRSGHEGLAEAGGWHSDCSACCGWPLFESLGTTDRRPRTQPRPSSNTYDRGTEHVEHGLKWSGCGLCPCCEMARHCAAAYSRGHIVL